MQQVAEVKRGFADLAHGQTHYRTAGSGAPLLALHASPGSSRQLLRFIHDMSDRATVYAPDTPGNGDSAALFDREPLIRDLAEAELAFMDAKGLAKVDVYGSHTGAAIAVELAILAPDRIGKVVLDGISWLTPEELEAILANYAFPFVPDRDGSYLVRLFQFCRDQYLFFPWYDKTRAARRDGALGSPEDLHAWVLEVMKASQTYHLNYRAAFRYDAKARLPLVTVPALAIAAENDPLLAITRELATLLPDGRFEPLPRLDAADFAARRKAAIAGFLAEPVTA